MQAIHQCLHGDFVDAFILNPLMFCLLPFILLYIWCDRQTDHGCLSCFRHPVTGWVLCGVLTAFWVLRNVLPLDINLWSGIR